MVKIEGDRGFTLLEVLIVMSVFTIMLSFSVFTLKHFGERMQKKLFISQLEADLYYAHSYAINNQGNVAVTFSQRSNKYEAVNRGTGEYLFKRAIPQPIYISESNLPHFTITSEGTVTNFGSISFDMNGSNIQLTFFIGRGRFIVKE